MDQETLRIWVGRASIGLVFFFNVQCALAFLLAPAIYAPGLELEGAAGEGMLRGMGILFLMWNVPYAVALAHPVRHRVSLYEAVAMQAIGLVGETILLVTFPAGHPAVVASVERFILFDGFGLLALIFAAWISRPAAARRRVA